MAAGGASSKPAGWRETDGHSRRLGDLGWGWGGERKRSRDCSCPDTPVRTSHWADTGHGGPSPWVEHHPSPKKNGHSTGVPLAACRRPQAFIHQEALELVTRCRGITWAGPCARSPGGACGGARWMQRWLRTCPCHGRPRTPALRAETGRSRCDLLESSTQSDEDHHCPPLGDTGPTQGPVSTQTRTSTAAGNDAGEGGLAPSPEGLSPGLLEPWGACLLSPGPGGPG